MGMSGITATGTLPLPKWLFFLRVAIIVLSLGVLVASAYNISTYDQRVFEAGASPPAFLIFCVVATWFILGTMLVFEFFFHRFYMRLVFIVLLAIDAILWLPGWAWAASWAGQLDDLSSYIGRSDFYYKFYGSVAAAAALGAVVWVMIVIFIAFFVRACMREGRSGVHEAELGHQQPKVEGTTNDGYPLPEQRYA